MGKPRGQHPEKRLTAVSVRNAKRPGRHADGNDLYLLVDPSGAKRWIWRGVIAGKRCELGLGGVQVVPLIDARAEAMRLKGQARKGENPLADRRRLRRGVPTFRAAAKTVHAAHGPTFKNPKHRAQWITTLETYAFPAIGDRPVDTITSPDILRVLMPIWLSKPETARRVKQRIKAVFDWAKAEGVFDAVNPTDGVTKGLPKHSRADQQHHAALPYQSVPAFVTTLRTADTTDGIRLAFELAILTATRTSEVLNATWDEVDLDARVWTVPAGRMKMHREHRIPLAARAVEIFERAKAISSGGPYVFPGRKAGKPLSNMAFLMLLRRRLHCETITTHGFRSSFRDWAAERTNVPSAVCEAALAHKLPNKAEAAYNRTDLLDKRRDLMATWAHFVTATPAIVVPLRA